MILTDIDHVSAADFAAGTGWTPKPEGLCRGEICVPAPSALRSDGTVHIAAAAERLGMPIVHDTEHKVWAIGPGSSSGHQLSTTVAADPDLIDKDGNPFRLSSLHGRKVVLVAWSSY
jgi:hypothetical protein